jgi:hypothetical protein
MKIRPVVAQLFHADERMNMVKLMAAFCNFAKAPKKGEHQIPGYDHCTAITRAPPAYMSLCEWRHVHCRVVQQTGATHVISFINM